MDALDRESVFAALASARPDAVIHQLTDLSHSDFEANSRLRIVGTRNLVDAARAIGVPRLIAQSIAFAYAPGGAPAGEDEPLDLDAPPPRQQLVAGVQALEAAVAEMPMGIILRYGLLYGPGTWFAHDGERAAQARRGELTITAGVTSFVHVADAALVALLALDWPPGPTNVVDDEPAAGTAWGPLFAAAVGAPAPTIQTAGRAERGAVNTRARRLLNWQPIYPTWRSGFQAGIG